LIPISDGTETEQIDEIQGSENPFKTYYSEPGIITALEIYPEENIYYIGTPLGLFIRDFDEDDFEVIAYFDGLDSSYITDLELDKENNRLFIMVEDWKDIFVLDLTDHKINDRYSFVKSDTMVNKSEFNCMFYESEKDHLYLGSNGGLGIIDLETEEFMFYDIMHFDIKLEKCRYTNNIGQKVADLNSVERFVITGFDYNSRTGDLFVATSIGLTIFNTNTFEFKNYRNNSILGGFILDIEYIHELDKIILGKEQIIVYDLATDKNVTYPKKYYYNEFLNETFTYSVYELSFDWKNQIIYAYYAYSRGDLRYIYSYKLSDINSDDIRDWTAMGYKRYNMVNRS
jgi:hypothetical protein